MKTYGLILADNGSNWYFQGTADTRWTYSEVDQLKEHPRESVRRGRRIMSDGESQLWRSDTTRHVRVHAGVRLERSA